MEHTIIFREVDRDIFDNVASGSKTKEVRAGSEEYSKVQIGDSLLFCCGDSSVKRVVKKVETFKNLSELFQEHRYDVVLPGALSTEDCEKRILSFPGYVERISTYGLFVWHLGS